MRAKMVRGSIAFVFIASTQGRIYSGRRGQNAHIIAQTQCSKNRYVSILRGRMWTSIVHLI
ncbi:hypothetical protein Hanom_Chr03g00189821 [Helianthus anomalus]